MTLKVRIALFAAVLAVASSLSTARADTIAYNELGIETDLANYGGGGFNFTVSSAIDVTQLGFYAIAIGGGDTPHIYLWNVTTSTMLADSGNIQSQISGRGWTYFTLPMSITLTPGDTYQVSAPVYWAQTYSNAASFTYASEITPVGFVNSGSAFGGWIQAAPYANPVLTNVPAVANLQFVAVPEPSSVALLTLGGLATVGGLVLKRRRA